MYPKLQGILILVLTNKSIQGWRKACKFDGAQASGTRIISHLGGLGGHAPLLGTFRILTPGECF